MDWLFHIVPARPRWRPRRKNAPWDAGGRSWRSENDSGRRSHLRHISPRAEPAEKWSRRLEATRFLNEDSARVGLLARRSKPQPMPEDKRRTRRFVPSKAIPFDCLARME